MNLMKLINNTADSYQKRSKKLAAAMKADLKLCYQEQSKKLAAAMKADLKQSMEAAAVKTINKDIKDLEEIYKRLKLSLKDLADDLNTSSRLKDLRARIDSGVSLALKVAETSKTHLESTLELLLFHEGVSEVFRNALLTPSARSITYVGEEYRKLIMEVVSVRNAVLKDFERRVLEKDRYTRLTGEAADYKTAVDATYLLIKSMENTGNGDGNDDLDLVMVKKVMEERAEVVMKIHASSTQLEKVLYDMYVMVKKRVEWVAEDEIEDLETLIGINKSIIRKWINKGSRILINKGCRVTDVCTRVYPTAIRTLPPLVVFLLLFARVVPKSKMAS